jgi:hypothetical protein
MSLLAEVDVTGVYGSLLHYVLVILFVGTAFLVFVYLWWNGKLGMDEGPKYRMMQDDEIKPEEKNDAGRK